MKKTLVGLAGTAILLSSGLAMAVPIQFMINPIYVSGRTYDVSGVPTNTLSTDPVSPLPQTLTPNVYKGPDGIIDSNAVGKINNINDGTNYFFLESSSEELTFVLTGADDVLFVPPPPNSTISQLFSLGMGIDVYLDNTPDFQVLGANAGNGAGDGVLVLSLAAHDQIEPGTGGLFDLQENYIINDNVFTGSALLDVTGGLWASIYDTNTISAPLSAGNGLADFTLSFSLDDIARGDWFLSGTANGVGDAVPEPATMLLFGTGLIGLAAVGRRKNRK